MPIRVQPPGMTTSFAELGTLAGEATKTQREDEIKRQEAAEARRARQQLSERMMSEFFNTQARRDTAEERAIERDRQKETRLIEHRWDLEAFNRAKAWDVEKMEMISRVDFAREEKKIQRDLDQFDASKKAIEEYPNFSEEERQQALKDLLRKKVGLSEEKLGKQPSPIQAAMAKMLGGKATEVAGSPAAVFPKEMKPIETAVDLLGQIELSKRNKVMKSQIIKQTATMGKRLVEEINKLAGFEKVEVGSVPAVTIPGFGGMPRTSILGWPNDALNPVDVIKLSELTEEEMATIRSAIASGDQRLIGQFIRILKQMKPKVGI